MGFLDDGLVLGLGFSSETTPPVSNNQIIKPKIIGFELPSLSLGLISGNNDDQKSSDDQQFPSLYRQQGSSSNSPHEQSSGTVSSLISSGGNRVIIKRERDLVSCGDEIDAADQRVISGRVISDEDEDGSNARKKLRLNKQQSALLEESFKLHSTLNPKQKQALARQLNLRPRQVEVWFQNRRARTKLKQTEVDCEFLKKCCETLTDENRRLQKEVQELKALKLAQPFYMQMPAATLTMCPSCERIGTGTVGVGAADHLGPGATKNPFSLAPKTHHFYNSFPNPSAAC